MRRESEIYSACCRVDISTKSISRLTPPRSSEVSQRKWQKTKRAAGLTASGRMPVTDCSFWTKMIDRVLRSTTTPATRLDAHYRAEQRLGGFASRSWRVVYTKTLACEEEGRRVWRRELEKQLEATHAKTARLVHDAAKFSPQGEVHCALNEVQTASEARASLKFIASTVHTLQKQAQKDALSTHIEICVFQRRCVVPKLCVETIQWLFSCSLFFARRGSFLKCNGFSHPKTSKNELGRDEKFLES